MGSKNQDTIYVTEQKAEIQEGAQWTDREPHAEAPPLGSAVQVQAQGQPHSEALPAGKLTKTVATVE